MIAKQSINEKVCDGIEEAEILSPPKSYAIIKRKKYINALTCYQEGEAFLVPIGSIDNTELTCEGIIIEGVKATPTMINGFHNDEATNEIMNKLVYIWALYNFFLANYSVIYKSPSRIVKLKYRDILGFMHKNKDDSKLLKETILSLRQVVGVIGDTVLPVIMLVGSDNKYLYIRSPYLGQLIKRLIDDKNYISKNEVDCINRANTYVANSSILGQRNHRAVELVHIIVALMANHYQNDPCISLKKLYSRATILRHVLLRTEKRLKDQELRRVFTLMMEYLHKFTGLKMKYVARASSHNHMSLYIPVWQDLEEDAEDIFFHFAKHTVKNKT